MSRRKGRLHKAVRLGSSLTASLLLQARNLIVSLVVFRLFDDPVTLWGAVSQAVAVVTVLALPAKLGLEFTAVQLVSKYREDAPAAALHAIHGTAALRLVLSIAMALPMLIAPAWVGAWVGMADLPTLVEAGGALLLATSLYEYATFLVSATDDFASMAGARLAYTIVNVGLIALVAWVRPDEAAVAVVLAQAVAGFAALGAVAGPIQRRMAELRAHAVALEAADQDEVGAPRGLGLVRAIFELALPMTLVSAGGQLFSYLDRVLLPVLASREALGTYALSSSIIAASLFGTYAFRNVARTRLPGELRRDPAQARDTLMANYKACALVGLWIAAGAMTVAPDLVVLLFGPDAVPVAAMLPWFAPYVVLTAHATLSGTALVAADRPRVYTVLTGALLGLNLALNLALIPVYEGYGALLAMTLSTAPLAVWSYREVAKAYGEALWSREALVEAVPTTLRLVALGVVAAAVGLGLSGPTWAEALTAGVAVSAVMGALGWLTGDLRAVRAAA